MAYTLTATDLSYITSVKVNGSEKINALPYVLQNGDTIVIYAEGSLGGAYGSKTEIKVNGTVYEDQTISLSDTDIVFANGIEGVFSNTVTINYTATSTPRISVDVTTLPGWANLSAGEKNITIVAKANGYKDSAPSAAVKVTKAGVVMPAKGDIITLDSKQYRVLKTEGTVAEVLAMYDASTSIKFDSASSGYNNTYAGKSLDTYCNNTFYSGLSAAMKNAIVDKTFTQDSWKWDSSVPTPSHYTGKYGSSTYYLTLAAFGTTIKRHCYVLSVQDVLDYLGATTSMGISDTTLTDTNIWKMFWNQTTSPGSTYPWLRSAFADYSDYAFRVYGRSGRLGIDYVDYASAVRPAFQIDLSKISWS